MIIGDEKAEKFDDRVIIYKPLWKWWLSIENEKGLITSEDFNTSSHLILYTSVYT